MNLAKLNPWNWFKKEEEQRGVSVPIQRMDSTFHPLAELHNELDRMFDRFFHSFGGASLYDSALAGASRLLKPNVDIAESDKEYTITVEVPGVDKEGIQISLDDGTLTIRGEKKQEKEEKNKNYHRIERSYGSFQRVLSLPNDADSEKIDATFKNGVLTLTLPKIPGAQPSIKTIPIR